MSRSCQTASSLLRDAEPAAGLVERIALEADAVGEEAGRARSDGHYFIRVVTTQSSYPGKVPETLPGSDSRP